MSTIRRPWHCRRRPLERAGGGDARPARGRLRWCPLPPTGRRGPGRAGGSSRPSALAYASDGRANAGQPAVDQASLKRRGADRVGDPGQPDAGQGGQHLRPPAGDLYIEVCIGRYPPQPPAGRPTRRAATRRRSGRRGGRAPGAGQTARVPANAHDQIRRTGTGTCSTDLRGAGPTSHAPGRWMRAASQD